MIPLCFYEWIHSYDYELSTTRVHDRTGLNFALLRAKAMAI